MKFTIKNKTKEEVKVALSFREGSERITLVAYENGNDREWHIGYFSNGCLTLCTDCNCKGLKTDEYGQIRIVKKEITKYEDDKKWFRE